MELPLAEGTIVGVFSTLTLQLNSSAGTCGPVSNRDSRPAPALLHCGVLAPTLTSSYFFQMKFEW